MTRALGRYEIIRPLARGGMAELFLARRRGAAGVEKRVVLKRVRAERAGDPRFLELFVREARLSMALAHQNIVPVFDFGRAGDELFLAMEHVDGLDLGEALRRAARSGTPLDAVLVAFIGLECCQALAYAHGRIGEDGEPLGVVHRDVTPRNVLLSAAGEVKLVDFGVAALSGAVEGRLRGTPAYMAPEQACGRAADARADLYGLGLVLREAATGVRARAGVDAAALLDEAREGKLPPLPPGVPAALAEVIERATQAEPAARFADAREMHDALDAFLVRARAEQPDAGVPARRLAAWLKQLVEAEPLGQGAAGAAALSSIDVPVGAATVTFLDDGEQMVLGQATMKSIAETVADETAAGAGAGEADRGGEAEAAGGAVAKSGSGSGKWVAIAVAVIGGVAGVVWASGMFGSTTERLAAPVMPDAAVEQVQVMEPDAEPVAVVEADAAVVVVEVHPDAAPLVVVKRAAVDAGVASPKAVARRKVQVNTLPWSYFWIDQDPTRHETPETVELAPGQHTIRFENPQGKLGKTIKIEVPEDRDITIVEELSR